MSATGDTQRESNRPSLSTRLRDGFTFLGAWAIIAWQMLAVPPRDVNETFLVLAAGLLGVPFGAEAVARIRSGAGTTPSGSGRQSPESSASSPSSPSGTE